MQNEKKTLEQDLKKKENELKESSETTQKKQDEISKLTGDLLKEKENSKMLHSDTISLRKERDNKEKQLNSLSEDYENLKQRFRQSEKENQAAKRLNIELTTLNKRLEDGKFDAVNEKIVAMNSVSALTREIEWLRKEANDDKSKLDLLEVKKEKFKANLDQI